MKKKQILSLILAGTMCFSLVACGNGGTESSSAVESSTEESSETESSDEGTDVETEEGGAEGEDSGDSGEAPAYTRGKFNPDDPNDITQYIADSDAIYESILGDFQQQYETAKASSNPSERYALMAIAEAKFLETSVMLPLYSLGGTYAIYRTVPGTKDYTLWGSDRDRYHQVLVCTEPILAEHYTEMKAKWAELRGTGTYEEWVRGYIAEKGYTLKEDYITTFNTDVTTWDVLATDLQADSNVMINTYDGLLEYNGEGVLQPALAESYEVSEDGTKYTFHLRAGAEWVDSQGRKVADVCADDFVASMQHMLDAAGGLEYLVDGLILNASEYLSGDVTDFAEVGVKAVDDLTVEYTLTAPCTYFDTMLGYSIFAPMSRSYYTSQGGKFGQEYDSAAADYAYGKGPDSIAYCGPYVVTSATASNSIIFKANESYWNKDNINVKSITWLWNDGSEPTKAYNDMKAGTIDNSGLNAASIELAKSETTESGDTWFDKYAVIADTDATTYAAFYNVNRTAFANFNDDTVLVSPQTDEDAERTNKAMNNLHFRRAITFAADRGSYYAQLVGDELKYASMRNSYTPANFVVLAEEVTVDINGTATTFPAGTLYGEIMQAQLDADEVPIKAYDPTADEGAGSGDGYDGWYNPDAAVAELELAIAELAEEGVVIDEENPIYLDFSYNAGSPTRTNSSNAWKQSVENVLGKKVIVNTVESVDAKGWNYAGYYTDNGFEVNGDIYDLTGWGPDYGDPSTYLDTFLPGWGSGMMRFLGIY